VSSQFQNYQKFLQDDAENFVNEYWDKLLDEIKDGGIGKHDAWTFIDDDCYIHEHVDGHYIDFDDAYWILKGCDDEETDSGLWEGQSPKDAIVTMAFFTYRAELTRAVAREFAARLEEYLEEQTAVLETLENEYNDLERKRDSMEGELDVLQGMSDEVEQMSDADLTRMDKLIADIDEISGEIEEQESKVSDQESLVTYIENTLEAFGRV
jgi:predicted ribosome quality control (RQC) complex YloA/Tae2 family protein